MKSQIFAQKKCPITNTLAIGQVKKQFNMNEITPHDVNFLFECGDFTPL